LDDANGVVSPNRRLARLAASPTKSTDIARHERLSQAHITARVDGVGVNA
jgi:hypothetical protein